MSFENLFFSLDGYDIYLIKRIDNDLYFYSLDDDLNILNKPPQKTDLNYLRYNINFIFKNIDEIIFYFTENNIYLLNNGINGIYNRIY